MDRTNRPLEMSEECRPSEQDLGYLKLACMIVKQAKADILAGQKLRRSMQKAHREQAKRDAEDAKDFLRVRMWDKESWWTQLLDLYIPAKSPEQRLEWCALYVRRVEREEE